MIAISIEALALIEMNSIGRALVAQDAALKQAPVTVLACAPLSPGKAVVLWHGDVACTQEALRVALAVGGSGVMDHMFLAGVHPAVVRAVRGIQHPPRGEALAILESHSVAGTLLAADAAVKCVGACIGRMHLACGYGGRGYFTLQGPQAELEAAVETAVAAVGERGLEVELLPAPHPELAEAAFVRPWGLDPARSE